MCGCLGGIFGTFLSHPADTVRINKQIFPKDSIGLIVRRIYNGGILSFYKGLSAPFFGIGLEKALVFGTFYNMAKVSDVLPFNGFVAGLVSTVVVTPVEKVKIDLQNNLKFRASNYSLSKMYKGWIPNVLREGSGYAIYFSIYENIKLAGDSKFTTFAKGALSGLGAWLFIYPFDYIKTLAQTEIDTGTHSKKYSALIRYQYQTFGLKGFYIGIELALMRCLPLHGGVFVGYEIFKERMATGAKGLSC